MRTDISRATGVGSCRVLFGQALTLRFLDSGRSGGLMKGLAGWEHEQRVCGGAQSRSCLSLVGALQQATASMPYLCTPANRHPGTAEGGGVVKEALSFCWALRHVQVSRGGCGSHVCGERELGLVTFKGLSPWRPLRRESGQRVHDGGDTKKPWCFCATDPFGRLCRWATPSQVSYCF